MEFYQYMTLLQRTTQQTQHFWEEVLHPEPDEAVLRSELPQFADRNRRIREKHDFLVALFSQSTPLLQAVINDYFELVLNISPGEPFHPIKKPKEGTLPIRNRKSKRTETEKTEISEKLSLNNRCFSADSETPMLLVSVEPLTFGNIVKTNMFFEREKQRLFGCIEKINDMIIPEMHASHFEQCLQLFAQARVFSNHDKVIAIGKDKNLLTVSLVVQAAPTLANGMLHGVFITKIQNKRGLFALDKHQRIHYRSEPFQLLIDNQISEKQLLSALQKNKQFLSADTFKQVCFQVCGSQCTVQTLSCLSTEKDSLVFCELKSTSKATQSYEHRSSTQKMTTSSIALVPVRNKKSSFQTSTASCVNMKEQSGNQMTAEVAFQRQERLNKEIGQTFQRVLDHNRFGARILKLFFYIITPLILIQLGFSVSLIPIKIQNQEVYSQVYDANQQYHHMVKLFIETAADLQRVMTNQQSLRFYEDFIKKANNYRDIDQIVSYMAAEGIEEYVPTFTLENNGSFSTKNMKFNQAVADKIKIPLGNLLNAKHSDFDFSFWRQEGTVPSSSVQDYYWTFMANAVYSIIPNFYKMKFTTIYPLLAGKPKISKTFLGMLISIIFIVGILTLIISYHLAKIAKLTNFTYQLFEAIDSEKHEQRLQQCRQFSKKYLANTKPKYPNIVNCKKQISGCQESQRPFQVVVNEQNLNIKDKSQVRIKFEKTVNQRQLKKKKLAMERNSPIKAFFVPILLGAPVLALLSFLIVQETTERKQMTQNIGKQVSMDKALELLMQSNLYSLNLGMADSSLENSFASSTYLQEVIRMDLEHLYSLVSLADTFQAQRILPTLKRVMYNDICRLDQDGFFQSAQDFLFPGRFNYEACLNISNQIITKGYISVNIYLMQKSTQLIDHNRQVASYNLSQRMTFYEQPYFDYSFEILNYIQLAFIEANQSTKDSYFSTVFSYQKIIIMCVAILITAYIGYLFTLKHLCRFLFNGYFTEVRVFIMLTSFRTTLTTPVLRKKMVEQIQNYHYF